MPRLSRDQRSRVYQDEAVVRMVDVMWHRVAAGYLRRRFAAQARTSAP